MEEFSRIQRLPPYVFAVVGDLKMKLRRQNIDIVDFSMGNPDIPRRTSWTSWWKPHRSR